MELLQYLAILKKWARLIVLTTLLAAIVVAIISYSAPTQYEAEAQVAIIKTGAQINFDPRFRTVSDLDTSSDQAARRKSLALLAKNLDIAATVIGKLRAKLDERETDPTTLMNTISASIDGDLVRIRAKSDDPERAALIANAWAQEFQTRVNTIYTESTVSTDELEAQTKLTQQNYDAKEKELVNYLATSPMDRLSQQIAQRQQKLVDLSAIENKLDRLIADATALRTKLAAGTSNNRLGDELAAVVIEVNAFNASSALPSNLFSSNIAGSASQPLNVQLRLDQFEGVPTAEQLRNMDALITTLEDRRKAIRAEANTQLYQEINQLKAQYEQENAKRQDLMRARDVMSTTLVTLMNKTAEVNIASQTKSSLVRIAAPAVAPQEPVSSRRLLNVLLASALGLGLGAALAFAYEYTHQTIRDEAEAGAVLGLPVVGVIPEMRQKARGANHHGALFVTQQPHMPTSEALHLLRHSLRANGHPWKVLLVASALPSEGKSTIAANLTASVAETGKRVLLIDADLRQPSQHGIFGVQNEQGLSDLLQNGVANWKAVSQPTAIDGLRVIPSGHVPADPVALLDSQTLRSLLDELRAAADMVVVDAPAVLGLADAAILAPLVDGVLLVVESERVSPREVLSAKEVLSAAETPIAVVLNRATTYAGARTYAHYAVSEARNGSPPPPHANGPSPNGTHQNKAPLRERLLGLVIPRRVL